MVVKVKVCGITNLRDAQFASSLGASALGFVFYKKSPRYILPGKARDIVAALPAFIVPVGVFVNESEYIVKSIAEKSGLSALQFHGDEPPAYCRRFKGYKIIKAFRLKGGLDVKELLKYKNCDYLFDSFHEKLFGGSGRTFDWKILRPVHRWDRHFILSGGLTPDNVIDAITMARPYGVDVSSGVEVSPGQKSVKLLRHFFRNMQRIDK